MDHTVVLSLKQVIFAHGTFIDGSTSELSCDGPLRDPFAVFCQVSPISSLKQRRIINNLHEIFLIF